MNRLRSYLVEHRYDIGKAGVQRKPGVGTNMDTASCTCIKKGSLLGF